MTARQIALCIPTILVSLIFGIVPWGLVIAAATLALYALVLFLPRETMLRANVNVALEGLAYGDVKGASDHIEIAMREGEAASSINRSDIVRLRDACDQVASALINTGQSEMANSLRKRCEAIASKLDHETRT